MASINKPVLIFCPSQDLPDIWRFEDGAIFVARKLSKPVVFHRGWRRREIRVLGEDVFQRVSSTKYWIIGELNWFLMSNLLRWAPKPGTTKGRFACRWIFRLELKKLWKSQETCWNHTKTGESTSKKSASDHIFAGNHKIWIELKRKMDGFKKQKQPFVAGENHALGYDGGSSHLSHEVTPFSLDGEWKIHQ